MIHLEILTLLWPLLTGRDKIFYHFSIHLYILSKFKPSDCFAHHVGPFSHVVEHRNPSSKVRFLSGNQIFFFVLAIHASVDKTFTIFHSHWRYYAWHPNRMIKVRSGKHWLATRVKFEPAVSGTEKAVIPWLQQPQMTAPFSCGIRETCLRPE